MSITAEAITFDQAVTTGAEAVEAARLVLRRAKDGPWPDKDYAARAARQDAIWWLAESLAAYERLSHGIVRPEDEISGLEPGPRALAEALGKVAEDVTKDAAVLADVIEKQRGDETAASVRGIEEGE